MGNWRDNQKSRPAGTPPARKSPGSTGEGSTGWQDTSPRGTRNRRDSRLWFWRIITLVLVGIGIWLIPNLFPDQYPPTPFIVVVVDSVSDPLMPPRPGATLEPKIWEADSEKLKRFKSDDGKPIFPSWKSLKQELDLQGKHPLEVQENGVVLISIAAQGAVNHAGQPCLFDRGSQANDPKNWVTVKEIIDGLTAKLPAKAQRVVLFLDSGQQLTDWTLGLLHDDFETKLSETMKDVKVSQDWTIVHARGTADLRRLADRGKRQIFAELLRDGLSGDADADQNLEIHKAEIVSFLESRLSGLIEDYSLISDGAPKAEPNRPPYLCLVPKTRTKVESVPLKLSLPESLKILWKNHLDLMAMQPWRRQPWAWAHYEWNLLRAERAWLAGDDKLYLFYREMAEKAKIEGQPKPSNQLPSAPSDEPWKQFLGNLDQEHFRLEKLEDVPTDASPEYSPTMALALLLKRDTLQGASSDQFQTAGELMKLRQKAVSAAVINDFRSERILRKKIDQQDVERRKLEDFAFLQDWDAMGKGLGANSGKYVIAQQDAENFATKLKQRDHFLAIMPWLFRWAEAEGDQQDQKKLGELWIGGVAAIQRDLNPETSTDQPASGAWDETYQTFTERAGKFDGSRNSPLASAASQLSAKTWKEPSQVTEALNYLATPLVSGDTRIKLLENISTRSTASEQLIELPPSFPGYDVHPLLALLKLSPEFKTEPGSSPPGDISFDGDVKKLDELRDSDGRAISECITQAPASRYWQDQVGKKPADRNKLVETYNQLELLDWRGRALAVASAAGKELPFKTPDNVIEELDRLQFETYLDWQARRALLDFYGPLEETEGWGEPHFLAEAARWIKRLHEKKSVYADDLDRRHKAWTNRSGELFHWKVDPPGRELVYGEASQSQLLKLTMEPGVIPPEIAVSELPPGTAAIESPLLKDDKSPSRVTLDELKQRGRNRVNWRESKTQEYIITRLKEDQFYEKLPAARVFFRGHRSLPSGEVTLTGSAPEKPIPQEFTPPRRNTPKPPTILVKGVEQKQKLTVVLVMDCSGSMDEDDFTENPARPELRIRRLTAAKRVLLLTLKQLDAIKEKVDLHVSFIAYGHRAGNPGGDTKKRVWANSNITLKGDWRNDQQSWPENLSEDFFQSNAPNGLKNLFLGEDVEALVPRQPFDASLKATLEEEIIRRIPLGITPLYRALIAAMDTQADRGEEKVILVLTDGVDNQEDVPIDNAITLQDVKDKMNATNQGQSIRILGLTMNGFGAAIQKAEKELQESKPETRKRKEDELAQLRGDLKKLNDLKEAFSGQPPNENARLIPVGSTVSELTDKMDIPIEYFRLQFADKDGINLEGKNLSADYELGRRYNLPEGAAMVKVMRISEIGGTRSDPEEMARATIHGQACEKLELVFNRANESKEPLKFHRVWEDLAEESLKLQKQFDRIGERRLQLSGWEAAPIATERVVDQKRPQSNDQCFRIAVRPVSDADCPDRPAFVRAIITPMSGGDPVPGTLPYFFDSADDIEFESGTTAPVLRFLARDFPKGATADLNVWLRAPGAKLSDSGSGVRLKTIFENEKEYAEKKPMVKVETEVNKQRIIKVDSELKGEPEGWPIIGLNLPPERIERRYYPNKQRMLTTFTIDNNHYLEMNLNFTDPAKLCDGAAELVWEKLTQDPR